MRLQLLFALLLLANAYSAQAQCNSKEYTRIFNEASTLQEKGAFIDAKNRYEAAKIYACGAKDFDKADDAVDALFEQIEFLRLQSVLDRNRADSTAESNHRQTLTAFANDIANKSATMLQNGDRNTAFRLAEFAHCYVEKDNHHIIKTLVDALYYNDNPDNKTLFRPKVLMGQTGSIYSVFFSPDGKWLATASEDNTVRIWDTKSESVVMTLVDQTPINTAIFSPDGKWLATAPSDSTVKIWDLKTGQIHWILYGHVSIVGAIAFSPDGTKLVSAASDRWGKDHTAKIWNLKNGKLLTTINNTSAIYSIAFSPDGKKIAAGDSGLKTIIWDSRTGNILRTFYPGEIVNCVAFSPDGKKLATGGGGSIFENDNAAKLWDLESGENIMVLKGHTSPIMSLAFSPDGKRLATAGGGLFGNNTVNIWDLESEENLYKIVDHTSRIYSVAFSPDGTKLATGSNDNTVKIWDLEVDNNVITFILPESTSDVKFSPDGTRFATGGICTRLWDIETGRLVDSIETPQLYYESSCIAFSPKGNKIAIASTGLGSTIGIYDTATILMFELIETPPKSIVFSSDGKNLVTGNDNGSLTIWDVDSSKIIRTINLNINSVKSIDFSSDGNRLAMAAYLDIKIMDFKNNTKLVNIKSPSSVNSISFSPGGERLVAGSSDNLARIWDLKSSKVEMTLSGHSQYINSVAFSPDNKWVATGSGGSYDKSEIVKIWDAENGKEIMTLAGHVIGAESVAFSPDSKRLGTGGANGISEIWEITGDGLIRRWYETGPRTFLSLSQLQQFNLESLLSLHPDNESKLIATKETWQIKAFADLAASQASGSNILTRVEPHYARADRLYAAALALQDELLIRMDYAKMLRRWAEVYQSDGLTAKATELNNKADGLWKKKK